MDGDTPAARGLPLPEGVPAGDGCTGGRDGEPVALAPLLALREGEKEPDGVAAAVPVPDGDQLGVQLADAELERVTLSGSHGSASVPLGQGWWE